MACTVDTCEGTSCSHAVTHGTCPRGQYCDATLGCRLGAPCASVADCARPDSCVTVTCNAASARCTYAPIDGDADGFIPLVCGGDDCDDSTAAIRPGVDETCDAVDQDCDERVDENNAMTTACGDESECRDGMCRCPSDRGWCYDWLRSVDTCADLDTDEMHCGGCGRPCPFGVDCIGGSCACPAGTTVCDRACVDLETDEANSGECGAVCPSGTTCNAGTCECPTAGLTACGECVDLETDRNNCGFCFNRCGDGVDCVSGECRCPGGGVTCGNAPDACGDPADGLAGGECGDCSTFCGGDCTDGVCTCPGADLCERSYRWGYRSILCTDFDTDVNNCGGCGVVCPPNIACVGGVCQGCAPPYIECDDPRAGVRCFDASRDVNNCGACGIECPALHLGRYCDSGACRFF